MQRNAIILACLIICVNCFAQQYPFVHYTPKDGLVNNRVRKAFQDSKGRIYFMTFGGLSVFDGARFRNYTMQNGLASDLVNDILELGPDSLLVAPNTGKFHLLVKGKLSTLKIENELHPTINYFYRHDNRSIYLSCDEGLFIMNKNHIRQLNISPLTNDPKIWPYLGYISGEGNYLILGTIGLSERNGLYLYDIANDRICDSYIIPNMFPAGKDSHGQVRISLMEKSYIVDSLALKKGKISLQLSLNDFVYARENNGGTNSFENPRSWLHYSNDGLIRKYSFLMKEGLSVFPVPIPEQVTTTDMTHLLVDRESSIWISTNGSGVFKIPRSSIQVFNNPIGPSFENSIYDIFYSRYGTWYSSNTNKIFLKSDNVIREFNTNLQQSPAVFFDDGKKLYGCDPKTIYEARRTESRKIFFEKIIQLPDSLYFLGQQVVDRYGSIIASIRGGLGVWKNHQLVNFYPIPSLDVIEMLQFDKNGLLWMVSRYNNTHLFQLHPEDPAHYLEVKNSFDKSQINGSPRCMIIDKEGFIWIGTRNDGLFKLSQEGSQLKQIEQFRTNNGLTDNFIVALACDSSNNIIAGTQSGVDRILNYGNENYRIQNLTKSSNYFSYIDAVWVETSRKAYGKTFSGGLIEISESEPERRNPDPELLLEEIRVNAKPAMEQKSFTYKQNNLSFFVAAPSFIDEKQVSYSYLLEGSGNDQWSDTTASNAIINLINLPPGKYKLLVKAFFLSTPYSPADLSYSFIISPPWWQTWWFRIGIGLVGIGVLVLGVRFYYRRKLEKEKALLEKQHAIEKERTRIATDMHDDLGAGLSRIKFLSETIGMKKQKHQPIEEDISKIREYSHEMIDKMGEIVWALNEKNDTLNDLLSYTRVYAVEYLTQNGIECKTEIADTLPTIFVSGEFRRNIFLTIKEALHNVVKHSRATEVKLLITANHQLSILLKDNGIGLDKNSVRLFSNGLSNMEKRVKEIGGQITITTSKGTQVKLKIPLPS